MIPLLLAALALQGSGLEVTARTDRSRAGVGEEVLYTLRATGSSTAAFRATLPPLDGFALLERRERTDVVFGARTPTRAYTLELRLRAEQVGSWRIGPILVEQGTRSGEAPAVAVAVVSSGGGAGIAPGIMALVQRVPPPSPGMPTVVTVVSTSRLFVGDQLDLLTAAWLPRALRMRLRQPPSLSPPVLSGVWAAPSPGVSGAVASRVIGGQTYDLFIGFQTAYPLTAGPLDIPAARLSWSEPARRRSGEELRRQVTSAPQLVVVRALPTAGRPAAFDGPVARDLRIEYRLPRSAARAGAVLPVDVVLSGDGNLALWPEPRITWPPGARAYQERVEERLKPAAIRRGGTKAIRYAVVPDSAGTLVLPAVDYPYFDPETGTYRTARLQALAVPVVEGEPVGERRIAPLLAVPAPPGIGERFVRLPDPVKLSLVALPLALLGAAQLLTRSRRPRAVPTLDAEQRLAALVHSLRPVRGALDPPALIAALRRRGVDREAAERLVSLHRTVESERYGPGGGGTLPSAMRRQLEAALSALPSRIWIRGLEMAIVAAIGLAIPASLAAQDPSALYREGRYAAAADGFRRSARNTSAAWVWYNLAASEYMARRDAHASAALLAASASAPRAPHIDALWSALRRVHPPLRGARSSLPVTPGEVALVGIALLWLGAPLAGFGRRRLRGLGWSAIALALAAGAVAASLYRQRETPRGVLAASSTLRVSPHGLAPEQGTVPAFAVVRLERRSGGWWLVRAPGGAQGWVPGDLVAAVPRLN